jgi:DNA-binding MarR family transcriptional regulator
MWWVDGEAGVVEQGPAGVIRRLSRALPRLDRHIARHRALDHLKTLEKRGLAWRRGHDEDGRLVLVSLEPQGRDVIERLFPAFNAGEALVSASLSERDKNQLATLLRKIIRTVEDEA